MGLKIVAGMLPVGLAGATLAFMMTVDPLPARAQTGPVPPAVTATAHADDKVGWDYRDTDLSNFKVTGWRVCNSIAPANCRIFQTESIRYMAEGSPADPKPPTGFSTFAFPLPISTPSGPYTISVQACNGTSAVSLGCSKSVNLTFEFFPTDPEPPVNLRIVPR